jgi:biopolymer transport protein ExbD
MELIPHNELRPSQNFNFAPMIDFLFLMLALFATLTISRAALFDSEIHLVELTQSPGQLPIGATQENHQLNLSITAEGKYKWITEFNQYPMDSTQAVQEELSKQYLMGSLSQDKTKTEILLHIDKQTPWQPIAEIIFAIKEVGFNAYPVYTEGGSKAKDSTESIE